MKGAKATPQAKSGPNQRASGWWSLRESRAGPGLEAEGGIHSPGAGACSLPLKGHHVGFRVSRALSLCLAWLSPQPQPSTCSDPWEGVLHVCWRRDQGRLASSKGPPLPKPTHPATTSPDGPAPRDPLRWTPSQTLLEAVRRFLLPKAGAPQPTFPSEGPGHLPSSWPPAAPSCPPCLQLAAPLTPAISGEGPSPERPQVRGPGDPRHNHTHSMPLPNPFDPGLYGLWTKLH